MQDLAENRQAEEPPFAATAEALQLGVPYQVRVTAEGRGRYVHLGRGFRELTGVPPETVLSDVSRFYDLVHPDDRAALLAEQRAAMYERRACRAEVRLVRPTGEVRWCRLSSAPRPQTDDFVIWDGLMTDITGARQLAEEVEEERHRLLQAVEVAGLGVFRWDRENPGVVIWSDRQYEIFGVPPQTPMSLESFIELVHPDDRDDATNTANAALEHPCGGDYFIEHRIIRPDGELRWVSVYGRIVCDPQGVKTIDGGTLDVTERRQADERRRLQMRELAHRGRNALNVMLAMVQQAARSAPSAGALAEVLISRLTAMAKSQDLATAFEGAPMPLAELVRQVVEPFDLARFELDPALETVTISGEVGVALALLLHELSTNAMKYGALSRPGGRVILRLLPSGRGRALVEWRETGGPPVAPPERQGFGSRLLTTALRVSGGSVKAQFAPDGFFAELDLATA